MPDESLKMFIDFFCYSVEASRDGMKFELLPERFPFLTEDFSAWLMVTPDLSALTIRIVKKGSHIIAEGTTAVDSANFERVIDLMERLTERFSL